MVTRKTRHRIFIGFAVIALAAIFTMAGCNTLQSVEIGGQPARIVYGQGQEFNPAGLIATEYYKRSNTEIISANALHISGYDKDKPGEQIVTVSYEKDGQRNSATFTVRVVAISKIVLVSAPDRIEYFVGEDLDLTGIKVNGSWEGIGEEPLQITTGNISGFDTNHPGKQTLIVSSQGQTASFPVTVVALQSIVITAPPSKTNYEYGEDLNLSGLKVQGMRQGTSSMEALSISSRIILGYDKLKVGSQRLTITIGGASASFTVTVAPNPFAGTWHGTVKRDWSEEGSDGKRVRGEETHRLTLIMSNDTWSLTEERGPHIAYEKQWKGTYKVVTSGQISLNITSTSHLGDRPYGFALQKTQWNQGPDYWSEEWRLTGPGYWQNDMSAFTKVR
jgi:hypothetical protein